jgi:plasmid segregation protein ParM
MIIGGDGGKHSTKVVTKKGNKFVKQHFRTKVDEVTESHIISSKSFYVDFKDKKYLIGDEAQSIDYDTTKAKLLHKLSVFTGIANLMESNRAEVELILGTPLSVFKDQNAKDAYRQYFLEDRYITLSVNGTTKRFQLNDVKLCPESIGLVYQNPSYYQSKMVGVIDIGGLNTNGAIYEHLKPLKETFFTINKGGNILESSIKRELNSKLGLNYQDYEIPYVMRDGVKVNGKPHPEGDSILQSVMLSHVQTILDESKKYNWNLQGMDIVFIGGTSPNLEYPIRKLLPHSTISANPIWVNAEGFYEVGEIFYGN